ncbi:asparagine synthase-related protein, partial [Thiolapillus sp.]|uniref:asparagine synthase-related protein n=1 Tax=Thiolapillus sp. TaxID=2017437 RepID=UPI0025DE47B0
WITMALCFLQVLREPVVQYLAGSEQRIAPFWNIITWYPTIPARYKIRILNEKFILKKSMAGLIPDSIRKRSKQPYRAPDSLSFFSGGKPVPYVQELLSEESLRTAGYFNPAAVGKLLNKGANGRIIGFADNMAFVGILSTMLLDKMFIQGYSAASFE